MGGINFGWLNVLILRPVCLSRKLEVFDLRQALWRSRRAAPRRASGRGVRAVPRLCIVYPGICLSTEEKMTVKPQSG